MMLKAIEKRMQAVIFHWFKVLLQNKENCLKVYSLIGEFDKNPNLFLNWV
jgi:hypothetical protein